MVYKMTQRRFIFRPFVPLLLILFSLFSFTTAVAQPVKLEPGMKRNTAQTLMGNAKIDFYYRDKTVYVFPDSVYFTIDFDEHEWCKGFSFSGENENALEKAITENGFSKRDSATYYAKDFQGLLKKEKQGSQTIFRFVPIAVEQKLPLTQAGRQEKPARQSKKKKIKAEEVLPQEKPFYGFTVLGMKIWEGKQKEKQAH